MAVVTIGRSSGDHPQITPSPVRLGLEDGLDPIKKCRPLFVIGAEARMAFVDEHYLRRKRTGF